MLHYYGIPPYKAPRGEYGEYYAKSQFGHGLHPAYGGVARQKGHGIGSLIGGLLRSAVPLLSTIGRKVIRKAVPALLSTGAGVLSDVIGGKSVKSSVTERAKAAGQKALKRVSSSAQAYINSASRAPAVKRRATTKGRGRTTKKQQKGGSVKKRSKNNNTRALLF